MKRYSLRTAFTLIELLVVLAIIGIVSLIGLYNLQESSIRSKVSRTKNDMRVLADSFETFYIDNNRYPCFVDDRTGLPLFDRVVVPMSRRLSAVTTPIAYLAGVPRDIFDTLVTTDGSPLEFFDTFDYADVAGLKKAGSNKGAGATSGGLWRLSSAGPDQIQSFGGDTAPGGTKSKTNSFGVDYDPTNGTVSAGDIVRAGPPSQEGLPPSTRRVPSYEEIFRTNPSEVPGDTL